MGDPPYGLQGGFTELLMGAANGFLTAEAVEETVDLMEEAGGEGIEREARDRAAEIMGDQNWG